MQYQTMPYTYASVFSNDRRDMSLFDTRLNQWHLTFHLLLCVCDSFCKDILLGFVKSNEE